MMMSSGLGFSTKFEELEFNLERWKLQFSEVLASSPEQAVP